MREVTFNPDFESWQVAARAALNQHLHPRDLVWTGQTEGGKELSLFHSAPAGAGELQVFRVPKTFLTSARLVARHSDPSRWSLLYRMLYRLTHGEPHLLQVATEPDVRMFEHLQKVVAKDAYRMQAFIRFRETTLEREPWMVAWYEPEHNTVDLNRDFFIDRFANHNWSILTPIRCMHWNREELTLSPGVSKVEAPASDNIEPLWLTYYSSVFNPARPKPKAMQAQLLKRNWKNLPEAKLIEPLLRDAARRTSEMMEPS